MSGGLEAPREEELCELWDPERGLCALRREASAVPRNKGREVRLITRHMNPRWNLAARGVHSPLIKNLSPCQLQVLLKKLVYNLNVQFGNGLPGVAAETPQWVRIPGGPV